MSTMPDYVMVHELSSAYDPVPRAASVLGWSSLRHRAHGTAEAARSRLETHEHPHRPGSPRMPEITTTPPTFRSAGPLHYNIL